MYRTARRAFQPYRQRRNIVGAFFKSVPAVGNQVTKSLFIVYQQSGGQTTPASGKDKTPIRQKETHMLRWAIIFFVIAILAAVFGFGGIAGAASGIAQLLFFVFLVLLVVSVVMHLVRGRAP